MLFNILPISCMFKPNKLKYSNSGNISIDHIACRNIAKSGEYYQIAENFVKRLHINIKPKGKSCSNIFWQLKKAS